MARIVQTDDTFTIDAPPLRLSFRRVGERWSHDLDCGGQTLASSIEFDPDRDDPDRPVSPAFQQLSGRELPAETQIMLVGQWGRHHGSAVFSVVEHAGGVVVESDVAVRSASPLLTLAATYLVRMTSGDLIDADPSAILWRVGGPTPGRLTFEPADDRSRVGLAEAGRTATRVQATTPIIPGAAHQRLTYRWRWMPEN